MHPDFAMASATVKHYVPLYFGVLLFVCRIKAIMRFIPLDIEGWIDQMMEGVGEMNAPNPIIS